jgi:hypothetical protein
MKTFETYQPRSIAPNSITKPAVFNGMCLIRRYKVTVEEIQEPVEVLQERLKTIWGNRRALRITHGSNINAMKEEAEILGIELK